MDRSWRMSKPPYPYRFSIPIGMFAILLLGAWAFKGQATRDARNARKAVQAAGIQIAATGQAHTQRTASSSSQSAFESTRSALMALSSDLPAAFNTVEPLRYTRPGVARAAWQSARHGNAAAEREVWRDLERVVDERQPALFNLRKTLAHAPVQRPGTVSANPESDLQIAPRIRAAGWLCASVHVQLARKQTSEARRLLIDLIQLNRFLSAESSLANLQVSLALCDLTARATWHVLQDRGQDDGTLEPIQKGLDSIALSKEVVRALDGEISRTVDFFELLRTGGQNGDDALTTWIAESRPTRLGTAGMSPPSSWEAKVWLLAWRDADEAFFLQTLLRFRERLRSGATTESWAKKQPDLAAWDREVAYRMRGFPAESYWVSRVGLPGMESLASRVATIETFRSLATAAVAVERCRGFLKRAPKAVAELRPWLGTIPPVDFLGGSPVRFRFSDSDTRVYSVGFDGQDQGGDPSPSSHREGDYTPQLGRDWVWPLEDPSRG